MAFFHDKLVERALKDAIRDANCCVHMDCVIAKVTGSYGCDGDEPMFDERDKPMLDEGRAR